MKRLHDRNKSAEWLYLFYGAPAALWCLVLIIEATTGVGPFTQVGENDPLYGFRLPQLAAISIITIIGLWYAIELWIAPSKVGPNKWGPQIVRIPPPPKY